MSNKKDTFSRTIIVVLAVCFVCSIVVSGIAVGLRSTQLANKEQDKQKNILAVAGLQTDKSASDIFKQNIQTKLVDLNSGTFVQNIDPIKYDQGKAAKDPKQSIKLTADQDLAKIIRRANLAKVYLVSDDQGKLTRIILPIHGAGLWSTMYAFIAIAPDGNTVKDIAYYEQGETPGLGDGIEQKSWTSQWDGKKLFDDAGKPAIKVVKGRAIKGSKHEIDGLSGATLTSNGVQNTFDFWLGKQGFDPFLKNIQMGSLNNG